MNRRSLIKKVGAASIACTAPAGAAVADKRSRPEQSKDGRVIYEDERGQIIRVARYAYVIRGAKSKEDMDFLVDKRDEILRERENGSGVASTQNHSDSGEDSDSGTYRDRQWKVSTDFWAHANDGKGEVEGTADAAWWGDAYWHDDPIEVQITIESHLKAKYENRDQGYVSVPPGYTVSENETKATLSHEFEKGESFPSLRHEKGAVTFYAGDSNCFRWIQQDDRFKYAYDTGEVEYYGTYVRADVGHCWW